MCKNILSIDIGGSSIKFGVYDKDINNIIKGKAESPLESLEQLIKNIREILLEVEQFNIKGIAISMPGMIDSKNGIAYTGGSLRYIDKTPLVEILSNEVSLPVVIINDAKSATLAEYGYGNLKDKQSAVSLILGTGVGGAILLNGQIIEGRNFSSGEFSYMNCNHNEFSDYNNLFGFFGGSMGLSISVEKSSGNKELNGKEIFKLIRDGNQDVLNGTKEFCEKIAKQIYNLQAIIDPECFIIGGGISEEPMFIELLKEQVEEVYSKVIIKLPKPDIIVCKYHNESNLLGAIYKFNELTDKNNSYSAT